MEQKKLRALMADAGVTDINHLSSNNGSGPRVRCPSAWRLLDVF